MKNGKPKETNTPKKFDLLMLHTMYASLLFAYRIFRIDHFSSIHTTRLVCPHIDLISVQRKAQLPACRPLHSEETTTTERAKFASEHHTTIDRPDHVLQYLELIFPTFLTVQNLEIVLATRLFSSFSKERLGGNFGVTLVQK